VRILKQTYQELVLRHRQPGRWLAAGGWLLLCLGILFVASFRVEIVCPGGRQTPRCILAYHSLTGLSLERDIQLKAVRSKRICGSGRIGSSSECKYVITLSTDAGNISFRDRTSPDTEDWVNQFIQDPSKTSFQIRSKALAIVEQSFLFVLGCMAIAVILQSVSNSLTSEEIYIVRLHKEKDWATVTRKQHSRKPQVAVTEFPVSAIASVNVGQNHLALKLKSGREVRIATAIWGKKTVVEPIGGSPVEVNQAFNETQKDISTFLQI